MSYRLIFAIFDEAGTILAVNASWRRFGAENGLNWENCGVGRNYLEVIEAAGGDAVEDAVEAGRGIRAVAAGERDQFSLEYPCHSPDRKGWFLMHVTRFNSADGVRVVTAHEEITELKRTEQALNQRLEELSVVHHAATVLAQATDLPTTLQAVSETATYWFGASYIHMIVSSPAYDHQMVMVGFERGHGSIAPTPLDLSLETCR